MRQELLLRQNFVDQLLYYTVAYYKQGSFKDFLLDSLSKMSSREARKKQPNTHYWRFLNLLKDRLRDHNPKHAFTLSIVEGFTKTQGILHKKSSTRLTYKAADYSNGHLTHQARGLSQEDAADLAEKRLIQWEVHKKLDRDNLGKK
jgi:hypothetical protein